MLQFVYNYVLLFTACPSTKKNSNIQRFLNDLCLEMIGEYRAKVKRRESRVNENDELRLQNVGIHFPEMPPDATGDNTCVVCRKNTSYISSNTPELLIRICQKRLRRNFIARNVVSICVLKSGSTCWQDWHTKKNYWS